MVRLKDIAARAGVSVMTVSKCLRDAPDVSAATKARIAGLAKEMGYVPDVVARGLRSRTSKLLGLIISSTTNPIFARIILGVETRAHELGYELLIANTLNEPEREEECIRRFLSRRVDGLIVRPVHRMAPTAPIYEELIRQSTPTVILGHLTPFTRQFVNVAVADLEASAQTTRHLIELGHRRIACLAGPHVSPFAQQRYAGYTQALREAGIEPDEHLVFHAGGTIEEGEAAAQQLLQENPGATAVQAVNDLVAIGAATVFMKRGLRIPQDMSVTGFGNILTAAYFRVPLTTVRAPKHRLGEAAVELMMQLLKGPRPEPKELKAELIIRDSTGPAPGRQTA